MEHIPYFDAHCDTIYRCLRTGAQLRENDGHLDLHRASSFGRFARCSPCIRTRRSFPGAAPWSGRDNSCIRSSWREMEQNRDVIVPCRTGAEVDRAAADGKMAAILSDRGGRLIGCDPGQVETAAEWGVRFLNPVWNWPNVLSGTNCRDTDRGLSPLGRRLSAAAGGVPYLPRRVPHQRPGVLGYGTPGPRASGGHPLQQPGLCPHRRNLTDDMFRVIRDSGGRGGAESVPAVCGSGGHHGGAGGARGALSVPGRGENPVPGRRLDGCEELAAGMQGVQDMPRLWQALADRGYPRQLLEDLFWNNLRRLI